MMAREDNLTEGRAADGAASERVSAPSTAQALPAPRSAKLRAVKADNDAESIAFALRARRFEQALATMSEAVEPATQEEPKHVWRAPSQGRGGDGGGSRWSPLSESRAPSKSALVVRLLAECEALESNPSRREADGLLWLSEAFAHRVARWGKIAWGTDLASEEALAAHNETLGERSEHKPKTGRLSSCEAQDTAAGLSGTLEAWIDEALAICGQIEDDAMRRFASAPIQALRVSQKRLWPDAVEKQRQATQELMRWIALWAPAAESEESFWEALARRASRSERKEAAIRGVAALMRLAASEASALWILAAQEGEEAPAIEQAERLFFDVQGGARSIRAKTLRERLALSGWTRENWSQDAFAAFSAEKSPWWPTRGASENGRREAAWRIMQARGGAWAEIWRQMCSSRWAGFRQEPARGEGAPRDALAGLFEANAWQWLETVPPKAPPACSLEAWRPGGTSRNELLAGTAFWRVVTNPGSTGLDPTLEQFARIYAWGREPTKRSVALNYEPLDDDGAVVPNWINKMSEAWLGLVDPTVGHGPEQEGKKLRPCEGLLAAWGRVARWAAADGHYGWHFLCVFHGPAMGEAFMREAEASAPDFWRDKVVGGTFGSITGLTDWPTLRGEAALGLTTRVSEWFAFNGLEQITREVIAQGADDIREEWIGAMERWSEMSAKGSSCRKAIARLKATRDAVALALSLDQAPCLEQPPIRRL
jgi:uncharacterized protein YeaO (DUF488 family)